MSVAHPLDTAFLIGLIVKNCGFKLDGNTPIGERRIQTSVLLFSVLDIELPLDFRLTRAGVLSDEVQQVILDKFLVYNESLNECIRYFEPKPESGKIFTEFKKMLSVPVEFSDMIKPTLHKAAKKLEIMIEDKWLMLLGIYTFASSKKTSIATKKLAEEYLKDIDQADLIPHLGLVEKLF